MMFDLTGKKALVTGGGHGIGLGVCLALARQGADTAVNFAHNQTEADKSAEQIIALGRKTLVIKADVSQAKEVAAMFETIKTQWGGLDILVNNAGVISYAPFDSITEDEWDRIVDTNLKGQFLCAKEAVKLMGQGSRIINIASIASGGVGIGFSNLAHYAASKGGVVAMTENMALDLAPKGINVNCIAPGAIESDMTKGIKDDPKLLEAALVRIPKKRIGNPEDIGAAAAFLASDEADYITGTVLYVDGGYLAG